MAWTSSTEKQRRSSLVRKYGITVEDYERILAEQGGVCAVCGDPERTTHRGSASPWSLSVDHDHVTGRVRGLLCTPCNRGIGFLRDDPSIMRRALEYLDAGASIVR